MKTDKGQLWKHDIILQNLQDFCGDAGLTAPRTGHPNLHPHTVPTATRPSPAGPSRSYGPGADHAPRTLTGLPHGMASTQPSQNPLPCVGEQRDIWTLMGAAGPNAQQRDLPQTVKDLSKYSTEEENAHEQGTHPTSVAKVLAVPVAEDTLSTTLHCSYCISASNRLPLIASVSEQGRMKAICCPQEWLGTVLPGHWLWR